MTVLAIWKSQTSLLDIDQSEKLCVLLYNYTESYINPLPDDKILNWSKFRQIADNSSKCI